jgi:3-oxoacyl-[acyl-carrier protein] reductase
MRLQRRNAVVTGTGAGIGREIAKWLTREGARVVGVDRDEAANQQTAGLITAQEMFVPVTADVSKAADVERVFAGAGTLDILVNNAASAKGDGPITEITDQAWDDVLAICLKSVYLCTKAALKTMLPKRAGVIVNLSSVNALSGINLSAYTAAKGGINSLTRLIAAHYGGYGIRANAICPGTILSETSDEYYNAHPDIKAELAALYPAGKFGKVEDIAAAVVYLVSEESNFINGTMLTIDGGLSAVHRLSAATPKLP